MPRCGHTCQTSRDRLASRSRRVMEHRRLLYPGTCGLAAAGKLGTAMTSLVMIAISLSVAYVDLFGAFFALSFAIRREDHRGTLRGRAPSLVCRSARYFTGWHRLRWDQYGPGSGIATA